MEMEFRDLSRLNTSPIAAVKRMAATKAVTAVSSPQNIPMKSAGTMNAASTSMIKPIYFATIR